MTEKKGDRIAKIIARHGVCSRREAEKMIDAGRVKVDGKIIDSPALVLEDSTRILVDDTPLPVKQKTRLWLYNKPPGLITSHKDEQDRSTVFDHLPKDMGHVISIGRLDQYTEGLLLLTNDGALADKMMHPDQGLERIYHVLVKGKINPKILAKLSKGIIIEETRYKGIQASIHKQLENSTWLSLTLVEGKNREIRRVMDHFGWHIKKLKRISYGPYHLGNLATDALMEVDI
jgi:23S rRNA pseudouridine2605 synthase